MKNILVPVGSVENGINNLRYAVNFAAKLEKHNKDEKTRAIVDAENPRTRSHRSLVVCFMLNLLYVIAESATLAEPAPSRALAQAVSNRK